MRNVKIFVMSIILVLIVVLGGLGVKLHDTSKTLKITKLKLAEQQEKERHLQAEIKDQKEETRELTKARKDLKQRLAQSESKLKKAKQQVSSLEAENASLKKSNSSLPAPSRGERKSTRTLYMTATAYTASCAGCSGRTSTGLNLKANPNLKVIAVDPNIIPIGTKVHVEGYGYAIAADKGGAIKGNIIDIFIPTQSEALKWGRRTVAVQILE